MISERGSVVKLSSSSGWDGARQKPGAGLLARPSSQGSLSYSQVAMMAYNRACRTRNDVLQQGAKRLDSHRSFSVLGRPWRCHIGGHYDCGPAIGWPNRELWRTTSCDSALVQGGGSSSPAGITEKEDQQGQRATLPPRSANSIEVWCVLPVLHTCWSCAR